MVDNSVNVQLGNKSASPKIFLLLFLNEYFHAMTQLSDHFHTKNEFDGFKIKRVAILFADPSFWRWPDFMKNYIFHFLLKTFIFFCFKVIENSWPPNTTWFLQINAVMTEWLAKVIQKP